MAEVDRVEMVVAVAAVVVAVAQDCALQAFK